MSKIPLHILYRILGVQKEEDEKDVLRIIDGTIPRVDFVDLGANGYGEEGFLVMKGRNMLGTMVWKDGKPVFVAKGGEDKDKQDDKPGIKMSGATKQGLAAQIASLQKLHDEAEEDDSVDGIPEEVLQVLGVVKDASPEDKQDAKPEPEPEPPEDKQEIDVPANLEGIVKNLTEAAGDSASTPEFQEMLAGMIGILSPETQAVAAVSKKMDGEMAELRKQLKEQGDQNAKLEQTLKALAAGAIAQGFAIPDGTDTEPTETKKKRPNPYAAAAGMNLSKVGANPDHTYKLPE